MTRSELERLRDARDYARAALELGAGCSGLDLAAEPVRLHALLFRIAMIGEALGQVSEAVTMLEPATPWRNIKDTRSRIVHAYWQIELPVIVNLVDLHLAPLITVLDRLIATLERETP